MYRYVCIAMMKPCEKSRLERVILVMEVEVEMEMEVSPMTKVTNKERGAKTNGERS